MKKIPTLVLISMMLISPIFSKEKTLPETTQIIALTELSTEKIDEILKGKLPEIAIECKEGTFLPLHFLYNINFASVKCSPDLSFKVEKTFYLRFVDRKVYMSDDLAKWDKPSKFIGGSGKTKTNLKISDDKSSLLLESTLVPATSSAVESNDQ